MKATDARVDSAASAGLGLICLVAVFGFAVLMIQRASLRDALPAFEPTGLDVSPVAATPSPLPVDPVVQQREQRALADFIARRYRIADTAAANFVEIAYRAGRQHSVDPVLILAVMAIESRYNPVAESVMGAKGLMQVIPKFHLEKLLDHGGEEALLDPEVNIHVGAQILREYYRRFGDQEMALQMYAGAFDEPSSQYANKVFAERSRLEPVRKRARKQTGQSA
jgi:soluble lytic murein transglycosylase-like protein